MAKRRDVPSRRRRSASGDDRDAPLPLQPVDLLAGLAPGVELEAAAVPPGLAGAEDETPATASVDEIGRMLRSGDSTLRRLVRGRTVVAVRDGKKRERPAHRAGVPPPSRERPGE